MGRKYLTRNSRRRFEQLRSYRPISPSTSHCLYGSLQKNNVYREFDESFRKRIKYTHFVQIQNNSEGEGFIIYLKSSFYYPPGHKYEYRNAFTERIKVLCSTYLDQGVKFSSNPRMKFECKKCKYIFVKDVLLEENKYNS